MINWSAFEAKVLGIIRKAMKTYGEKWVTAEVVEQHVGTLTVRFLKDHGQMFNRTRVEWTDKDGVKHNRIVMVATTFYPAQDKEEKSEGSAKGKKKE